MEKLTDNLYVMVGTGINVTALITDEGVVLVDTMPSGWWGPAVLARIRSVTNKPIVTIINTNSHPGHSGNNGFFSTTPVEIVSHENTKARLEQADNFKGAGARFLPGTTFREKLSLVRGRERIDLYYFGAASTNGDAWVVFPSLRIMHIGDIVKKNDVPEFERKAGGSGVAYPDTIARGMAGIRDVDTIIVGHAYNDDPRPTITWQELGEHQCLGGVLLAAVRGQMQAGKSTDEATASLHATETFKKYETRRLNDAVRAIYDELGAGRERTTSVHGLSDVLGRAMVTRRHPADSGRPLFASVR